MNLNQLVLFLAELAVNAIEPEIYDIYLGINPRRKQSLQKLVVDRLIEYFPKLPAQIVESVKKTLTIYEPQVAEIYRKFYIQGGPLSVRDLQKLELQDLVKRIITDGWN